MIIEIHILQNFVPANLNRDDTGSPKDCVFGGYRRARISSQCFKRAIRSEFNASGLLNADTLSKRTKRAVDEIAQRLVQHGKPEAQARAATIAMLNEIELKVVKEDKTEYLLFLAERELQAAVEVALEHWEALSTAAQQAQSGAKGKGEALPKEIRAELLRRLDGGQAADLALFGRMIANLPEKNVEAACQVAHAISTNKVDIEFDFFTAVDDLRPGDTAGADMLGTIEFNSACFYRYASVDTRQLAGNLGHDIDLMRRTLEAFLRASVEAIPTGKQNSMAAHNPPSLVLLVAREDGQWNLANAFLKPVRPQGELDLVQGSIVALDSYWGKLMGMYGANGINAWLACTEPEHLKVLAGFRQPSLSAAIDGAVGAIRFTN